MSHHGNRQGPIGSGYSRVGVVEGPGRCRTGRGRSSYCHRCHAVGEEPVGVVVGGGVVRGGLGHSGDGMLARGGQLERAGGTGQEEGVRERDLRHLVFFLRAAGLGGSRVGLQMDL